MAAQGEITPMPDAAIFADTGWEPAHVMRWLDWLETRLPFPVYRVMHREGLRAALLTSGEHRMAAVPFFMSNGGMGMRQCSYEYKIQPIHRKARELLGYKQGQRIPPDTVTMWIGISTDEALRQKPSRNRWITHLWPLIERRMTRGHCMEWLHSNGYPEPPKSACLGCPYHSDAQWLEIKANPTEWADTVAMDQHIRTTWRGQFERFMHRSLLPLDIAPLNDTSNQADMWNNECEGICGA